MNKTYHIASGPDGIHWLSIEPFQQDIMDALQAMMNMDMTSLKEEDVQDINMRILGLKAIYTMMGSLITEKTLEKLREQHNVTTEGATLQ